MIQAIIFDMDGVLIDSENYLGELEIKTLKSFGINATPKTIEQYFGVRYEDQFADVIKRYDLPNTVEEMLKKFYEISFQSYSKKFHPMPHVFETLQKLKSLHYPIGLATGSPKHLASAALKHANLLDFFDAHTYSEEVSHGKPDPEPFIVTAKKLNISPANIIVVEDSPNGFKAAKKAGMHLIGYKAKHNADQDFSLPDIVIEDLREIPIYIKSK